MTKEELNKKLISLKDSAKRSSFTCVNYETANAFSYHEGRANAYDDILRLLKELDESIQNNQEIQPTQTTIINNYYSDNTQLNINNTDNKYYRKIYTSINYERANEYIEVFEPSDKQKGNCEYKIIKVIKD